MSEDQQDVCPVQVLSPSFSFSSSRAGEVSRIACEGGSPRH